MQYKIIIANIGISLKEQQNISLNEWFSWRGSHFVQWQHCTKWLEHQSCCKQYSHLLTWALQMKMRRDYIIFSPMHERNSLQIRRQIKLSNTLWVTSNTRPSTIEETIVLNLMIDICTTVQPSLGYCCSA